MEEDLKYFEVKNYKILVDSNEVLDGNKTIKLTHKEMKVLVALYKNKGSTVSRSNLLESVWGGPYKNDLGLTQAISKLRRVFKDNPKTPILIRTIPKNGYQLINTNNTQVRSDKNISNSNKNSHPLNNSKKIGIILFVVIIIIFLFLLMFDIRVRIEELPV